MRNLEIGGARIASRNFSGRPGDYNNEGNRNFLLLLDDPNITQQLIDDGWNVKFFTPRNDGDEPQPYIKVKVNYNGRRPPHIEMINSSGRILLSEEEVGTLDWAEFENIDLVIHPAIWERGGRSGVSCYLDVGYFTIKEDPFAYKYRDLPTSAQSSMINGR